MEIKYSFDDLQGILNSINSVIALSKERKYSRSYMYGLAKNKIIIKQEQDVIREQFKDNAEDFEKFNEERFNLLVECGAETSVRPSGAMEIVSTAELDTNKFIKELEKLKNKYKTTLEKQSEIDKENLKIMTDKVASPEFYMISIEHLPEEVDMLDMPDNLAHIISP